MNQAKNIVRNMESVKEKQRVKNINALKNTEYSSIYSLLSFLASTILLFTNTFMENTMLKNIVEVLILFIMVVVCNILIGAARKKCEVEGEKYRSFESGVIVKMATNLGYLSPVVCVIGWVVTIEGIGLEFKIFLTVSLATVVFWAIQVPWAGYLKRRTTK